MTNMDIEVIVMNVPILDNMFRAKSNMILIFLCKYITFFAP